MKFPNALYRFIKVMIHSIAFVPATIATVFFLFSLLMVSYKFMDLTQWLDDDLHLLMVGDANNARTILGTLVGGLLSLTVFSFSMVMVVLTRASASLTPRSIPGLVSQKQNQIFLGFCIGAIIYSLILIAGIQRVSEETVYIPKLGILFAIIFGIIALGMFVNFIHSITRSIQVDFVLESIYKSSNRLLDKKITNFEKIDKQQLDKFTDNKIVINSNRSGYFNYCNQPALASLLKENDLTLSVVVHRGDFVPEGNPLFKINREVKDKVIKNLLNCFAFYLGEAATEHFQFGLQQMSEIAVKALSPGINDPGTATRAIDFLSIIMCKYAKYGGLEAATDSDNQLRVVFYEKPFQRVLYESLTSIREYGRTNALVMSRLMTLCRTIQLSKCEKNAKESVQAFATDIQETVKAQSYTALDAKYFWETAETYNAI